jgi:hypothetical protein
MLSVGVLIVVMLNVIMLIVGMLSVVMLNLIMLNVVMLNLIMLSVVMMSVVALLHLLGQQQQHSGRPIVSSPKVKSLSKNAGVGAMSNRLIYLFISGCSQQCIIRF